MPKPIVCLSEQLRQYLELFRSCFSKPQWKYFVIVLLGLIECEERKTMTGLLRASHLPLLLCCLMPKRQARVRSVPILEDGDNPRVLPTSLRPQPIPRLQPRHPFHDGIGLAPGVPEFPIRVHQSLQQSIVPG